VETRKVIETNLEGIQLGYLDEQMNEIKLINRDDLKAFPKNERLFIFMEATAGTIEVLVENIKDDLRDIWKRLDKMDHLIESKIR